MDVDGDAAGARRKYSRLARVGTWLEDDICWLSCFLWLWVGVGSCSNFQASVVPDSSSTSVDLLRLTYRLLALIAATNHRVQVFVASEPK